MVAKFLKNDSDNKWGEEFILIIAGHKSVQVLLESIIVNGVDYHARVSFFRNKDDISKWDRNAEYSFVRRNDKPRTEPSHPAKTKIFLLAQKIVDEAHITFPNLFLMADRNFMLDHCDINKDKAAELERQAKEFRDLNVTLVDEQFARSKFYNQIISDRINAKT